MKFQVNDILGATGGSLLFKTNTSGSFSISTDTRTITESDIFLPLSGENFDGHNFIETAVKNGIRGYFLDKKHWHMVNSYSGSVKFVIGVKDTREAYLKLANYVRKKLNPMVVAITGSSGKTTTKEMIFSVLSEQYKTHKSKLNHNNEIGLCQTILSMPDETDFLVIEMGMRGLGEIELLSKYSDPDIAVITNIGTAHIGRLGSIENIAKAKCEITSSLNKEGFLVAYNDKLIKENCNWSRKSVFYDVSDQKLEIKEINEDSSKFVYMNNEYELNVSGEYNIANSLAAIEIGKIAGISPQKIRNGLKNYKPIENRWQVVDLPDNVKLINDSYNANPDSVKAAVTAAISSYPDHKAIIVLGEMAELGEYEEDLHREAGKFLNDKNIYELITVGEKAEWIAQAITSKKIKIKSFSNNDEVVKYLTDDAESNSVILLKASRCMSFDNIAERLQSKK